MAYFKWGDSGIGAWLVIETLALSALVVHAGRSAPTRRALLSAAALAFAAAALPLRTVQMDDAHSLFVALRLCQWSVVLTLGAVLLTRYLRAIDRRADAAVGEARRAQRLALASDLHDFAAHDVNGMVVQAQAAQLVAERDPQQALAALRRIEQAGLHALASMDQTVAALRAVDQEGRDVQDGVAFAPVHGVADLPALVQRYAVGPVAIKLDLTPGLAESLPREVSTTAYRVVVEALTNVRRHAPTATVVSVVVQADDDPAAPNLVVTVVNDVPAAASKRSHGRRGGQGLSGLAERVAAIGGTLHTGLVGGDPDRWRVSAVMPLSRPSAA